MACILPAVYTRNIPTGTKFSHELSPNFGHPVEPQMLFGNGRKLGATVLIDLPYLTYRRSTVLIDELPSSDEEDFLGFEQQN